MIPHKQQFTNQHLAQVSLKFLATHPYNKVWSLNWLCFNTITVYTLTGRINHAR